MANECSVSSERRLDKGPGRVHANEGPLSAWTAVDSGCPDLGLQGALLCGSTPLSTPHRDVFKGSPSPRGPAGLSFPRPATQPAQSLRVLWQGTRVMKGTGRLPHFFRKLGQRRATCPQVKSHGQKSPLGYSPWGHRVGHDRHPRRARAPNFPYALLIAHEMREPSYWAAAVSGSAS